MQARTAWTKLSARMSFLGGHYDGYDVSFGIETLLVALY